MLALAEADADAAADGLHDGALQALVVARYAADAAVRGGDPAAARDAVQEALVALRRAVWLLRPRGAQGLLEALRQLAAHVAGRRRRRAARRRRGRRPTRSTTSSPRRLPPRRTASCSVPRATPP